MNRRVPARPDFSRWTALLLFGLAACIGIVVSACDQEPKGVVAVNADSAEAVIETVMPTIEAAVENESEDGPISVDDIGQLTSGPTFASFFIPPVEWRVEDSDVVVRAVFVSENSHLPRFRSIEYLKGTGPAEFEVRASTEGRNRKWDDREGVLLLSYGRNTEARRGEDERMDEALYFTNSRPAATGYYGSLPDTYMFYGRKPAWLPAIGEGVIRAEGDTTVSYTTGTWPYGGVPPAGYNTWHYTRPVTELREMIAYQDWLQGLDPNYRFPVTADTCQFLQEYYARSTTFVTELSSGTAEGDGVLAFERLEALETTDQYHILALNESDAILFDAKIIDSDSSSENGFAYKLANARPLARGTYEFMESLIDSWYASCSDDPLSRKRRYKVTVNAPTGTLHEAFFDPVGLSGEAIGATGSSGVIDPDEFTVGSDDVEIDGLEWRGGSVVLELEDYVSLSGQTLDFIKLDGSIDTSLDIADATVNQTATTWTWSLASQPWEDGDQLMLRIRETSA